MDRELQFAGEYKLLSLKIQPPENPAVDLSGIVVQIEIIEDIELPGIFGHCVISDTANLTNALPIIGEEKLELIIQTPPLPGFENFEKKEWKLDTIEDTDTRFDVYAVDFKVHSENFSQATYSIKFCSPEVLQNNMKRVTYSVNGTTEDIVRNIFQREFNSDKIFQTSETATQKNIIIPNLDPFSTIAYVGSVSEDGDGDPSFKFFENNDGYQYKSLTSLYQQMPHWEFGMLSAGLSSNNLLGQLQSLTGQNMKHNDKMLDIKRGVLGSTLLVHDIYNKRYLTKLYDYAESFNKEGHLKDTPKRNLPIYSSEDDYTGSRTFYQTMSIKEESGKQFNGLYSGSYKLPNELAQNQTSMRTSKMEQLNQAFEIECQAAGNTNLTAGKIVNLSIPKAIESNSDEYGDEDRFFQGLFLMTRVKHVFHAEGQEHKVYMHMVKDSQILPSYEDHF